MNRSKSLLIIRLEIIRVLGVWDRHLIQLFQMIGAKAYSFSDMVRSFQVG